MTNPQIIEHNVATDTVTIRPLNADETVLHNERKLLELEIKAEAQSKESARAAILDRLGLTADEAAILLG